MHASLAPLLLLALSASASPIAQNAHHKRHAHPANQIGQPIMPNPDTTALTVQPATTGVGQPGGPPNPYTTNNGDGKEITAQTDTTCTDGVARPTGYANPPHPDGPMGKPPYPPPAQKGPDDEQWKHWGPWDHPQQGPSGIAQQTGTGNTQPAQTTGEVKPTDGVNPPRLGHGPAQKGGDKGHDDGVKTVTVTVSHCDAEPTGGPLDGKNGDGKDGDGKNGDGKNGDGKNGDGKDGDGKNGGDDKNGDGQHHDDGKGPSGATTAATTGPSHTTQAGGPDETGAGNGHGDGDDNKNNGNGNGNGKTGAGAAPSDGNTSPGTTQPTTAPGAYTTNPPNENSPPQYGIATAT